MSVLLWDEVNSQMMSGDIAKNFKNEAPRHKDLSSLRQGATSARYVAAMYLAREALQNSVDSSRDQEFRDWLVQQGQDLNAPFKVTFRFVNVYGKEKTQLEDELGITELREMVESQSTAWTSGGPAPEVLEALKKTSGSKPLALLYIHEHRASGMYSKDDDDLTESKMLMAMYSHNLSDKGDSGSGGSFGHGKSALAAASRVRMNVAYSNFGWRQSMKNLVGLLGVAYYPMHRKLPNKKQKVKYTGFAFLAAHLQAARPPTPFWNKAAHDKAQRLGFVRRDSGRVDDYGTTVLIVDPDFGPEELEQAVADHWWPAICERRLEVRIEEESLGKDLPLKARNVNPRDYAKHKGLEGFPEALDALTAGSEEGSADHGRLVFPLEPAGTFSASIVSSATRYRSQRSQSASKHIVAYTRGIGMVAYYSKVEDGNLKGQREIRGIFRVSDPKSNELFRMSEPKTHDEWVKNATGLEHADQAALHDRHRQMTQGIKAAVRSIVSSEQSEHGDSKSATLLAKLLGPLLKTSGSAPSPGPSKGRSAGPVSIVSSDPASLDPTNSVATWKIEITHAERADSVLVRLALSAVGEPRKSPQWLPTKVVLADGVELKPEPPSETVPAGVYKIPLTAATGGASPTTTKVTVEVRGSSLTSADDFARPLSCLWGEMLQPEWRVEVVT